MSKYNLSKLYEELSDDQYDAINRLHEIWDELQDLSTEVRQMMKNNFPSKYQRGDAYGAFDFGTSRNRYDITFGKILEELDEDEGDELDENLDETNTSKPKPGYHPDGTPKSNDEMGGPGSDEFEEFYNDLDSLDEDSLNEAGGDIDQILSIIKNRAKNSGLTEERVAERILYKIGAYYDFRVEVDPLSKFVNNEAEDKALKEHFKRFLKDYQ